MPAFSFEKISPPIRRGPVPAIAKKQRGVIVQILDRFVEARVKRTLRGGKGVNARREKSGTCKSTASRVTLVQLTRCIKRLLQPSICRCRFRTSPRAR